MPKNTSMTRERKIALPVILAAARDLIELRVPSPKQRAMIEEALRAFDK